MGMIIRNRRRLGLTATILFPLLSCLYGQGKKPDIPTFRVDVDTVYVKVAVTDPLVRYVTGLDKEYFKVYEDKVQQEIIHFSQESAPISVGFIYDVSYSMGHDRNFTLSKSMFTRLLKRRNPGDEYFLITFNENVNVVQSFTDATSELQNDMAIIKTGGWTALYDAVYRGLEKIKEGRNEKKALIIISDGEENRSRYKWSEIREAFEEADVPVYGIGYAGPMGGGNYVLQDIARITGGRVFGGFWTDSINLVFTELRTQYLIGYVPTNKSRDGKWRKITIKLDPPPGFPKLKVTAKNGYYAPKH